MEMVLLQALRPFCPSCDIYSCLTDDIACCYQKKTKSLSEKQNLVLSGEIGKLNSLKNKTLPFEKLTVKELKDELRSRSVNLKCLKDTLKDLKPTLKSVLRGVK